MLSNMLNDLAEAMKALDEKNLHHWACPMRLYGTLCWSGGLWSCWWPWPFWALLLWPGPPHLLFGALCLWGEITRSWFLLSFLFTVIHLQNRTIQLALLSFAQMISEVSLLSFSVMSIFRCRVQFQMYGISRWFTSVASMFNTAFRSLFVAFSFTCLLCQRCAFSVGTFLIEYSFEHWLGRGWFEK